jgi:hypothetical protein
MSEHRDPVTGDILTGGEYVSWKIQGIIRRWTFLIAITIITIAVWSTANPMALTWWNLCASYLALVIESIVGIAMFSQTRRDAVALREVRAISRHVETMEEQNAALLARIDALLEAHKRTTPEEEEEEEAGR